jgi:hypothetical protein
MQRYCGFIQDSYRVNVQIPTTVYDALAAQIKVYRGSRKIAQEAVPITSLPSWNIPLQTLLLKKRDESSIDRKIKELLQ